MGKPPTPELAFILGAQAMQSKIVAWAMMRGLQPVALDVLQMAIPSFQMPEIQELDGEGQQHG